jgi:nucleoside-diphosphate-sugar epimerase
LDHKEILIIGGAGFIGSQLAIHFRDKGYDVTILDNFTRNAIQYFNHTGIEIIKGDILNLDIEDKYYDLVIHAGAICGIHKVGDIAKNLDVNIIGTRNVIEKFANKCKRLIFFSTCEVEGLSPNSFQYALFEPRWSYAISKVVGEYYCQDKIQQGLPITVVRPTNIFGIGQVGDSAITNFITHGLTDHKFILYDDGSQTRAWCYIDDFIAGMDIILNNETTIGSTLTIGNPRNVIQNVGLLKMICSELGINNPEIEYRPHFCTDIKFRCPDITAMKYLGYTAKVSLEDGIKRTINWYINTFIGE